MTYRVASHHDGRTHIAWRDSTDGVTDLVRSELEQLKTLDDFVQVFLDWDADPFLEIRDA